MNHRNDEGGRRWCCTDVETQRHVVRSIDAFLDCISSDTSQHPLVKVLSDHTISLVVTP